MGWTTEAYLSSISAIHERIDALTSQLESTMSEAEIRMHLAELCKTASEIERGLWHEVRDRHPGRPRHDPVAWKEWLDAADEVRALAEKLRELADH